MLGMMKARAASRRSRTDKQRTPSSMLRWTFHKGGRLVTCGLAAANAKSAYYVTVIPHWNVKSGIVEEARTAVDAFRRHAEIALRLRAMGWALAGRA